MIGDTVKRWSNSAYVIKPRNKGMSIIIRIKNVYGNELIYPVCENAMKFAKLTGKKTLSMSDIAVIKSLGYEVKTQTLEL